MTDFDAINVIRDNRSLLKRRKFKDVKSIFIQTSGKTALEFKQVSPEELAIIKKEIRRKAKEDARKEAGVYIACAFVVFYFLYWIFYI